MKNPKLVAPKVFSLCHLSASHRKDDLIAVLGDPNVLTMLLYYLY